MPGGGTQENLLPLAIGPAEPLSWYGRGYKHPVLDRPLTQGARCAARRSDGGVTDIESRLLGIRLHTDLQDAPTIRSCQMHPDQQELPVLRSRLGSVPWPVRPAMQSRVWTGDAAAPLPDYELRTGTPSGRKPTCRPSRNTECIHSRAISHTWSWVKIRN